MMEPSERREGERRKGPIRKGERRTQLPALGDRPRSGIDRRARDRRSGMDRRIALA